MKRLRFRYIHNVKFKKSAKKNAFLPFKTPIFRYFKIWAIN